MLMLTISLHSKDDPSEKCEIQVECNDMYDALYELQNVAGQTFRNELMGYSWQFLTQQLPADFEVPIFSRGGE